ncbi:dihydroorotase [Pseudaminobacter sp. NGMCC 1.201702]|uniref:dihydroorotase n=1 Tax=Pseudaminobacter sp. NGMCC 1.201702 TaxID=3391825 RepID=UPI0039F083D9
MQEITFRKPSDLHVHFRDGPMLAAVVPYTARDFRHALVMPNLVPPVTTTAMAAAYRERIMAAVPEGLDFTPLMTCYLTDDTDAGDLVAGFRDGVTVGAKLYPAHATTNSQHGVTNIRNIRDVLVAMADAGMPLLTHGERVRPDIDVFDREKFFIDEILVPTLEEIPTLRVVMEHITTADGALAARSFGDRVAATITPQHLLFNRNALFEGGLRPHLYCLPVLKREEHRLALRQAATSGLPNYLLGTDTAPHLRRDKEADCGCAGVFSAPVALEAYLQVFEEENALDRFERFATLNGAAFYRLEVPQETVTYVRRERYVAEQIEVGDQSVIPLHAGKSVGWSKLGAGAEH